MQADALWFLDGLDPRSDRFRVWEERRFAAEKEALLEWWNAAAGRAQPQPCTGHRTDSDCAEGKTHGCRWAGGLCRLWEKRAEDIWAELVAEIDEAPAPLTPEWVQKHLATVPFDVHLSNLLALERLRGPRASESEAEREAGDRVFLAGARQRGPVFSALIFYGLVGLRGTDAPSAAAVTRATAIALSPVSFALRLQALRENTELAADSAGDDPVGRSRWELFTLVVDAAARPWHEGEDLHEQKLLEGMRAVHEDKHSRPVMYAMDRVKPKLQSEMSEDMEMDYAILEADTAFDWPKFARHALPGSWLSFTAPELTVREMWQRMVEVGLQSGPVGSTERLAAARFAAAVEVANLQGPLTVAAAKTIAASLERGLPGLPAEARNAGRELVVRSRDAGTEEARYAEFRRKNQALRGELRESAQRLWGALRREFPATAQTEGFRSYAAATQKSNLAADLLRRTLQALEQ